MQKIPSSIPVFIQNIESNESGLYSTAKLKVHYIGETGDHRLFTEEFSKKIAKTLPSVPVVGYYSEDKEDFIGHNKVQYVYGHVPENSEYTYETDDTGNTFLITDVILYTGRDDNIGEVASKIIGKQHSLELNSETLQYKINRDGRGQFKNIEFTDGQLCGLSVLGDDETPAFKGSAFFAADETLKDFISKCHQDLDKILNILNSSGGEIQVFNKQEYFTKVADNLTNFITMQDFTEKIYKALDNMGIYGYICENTTDYVIINSYTEDGEKYIKYSISLDEQSNMTLSDPIFMERAWKVVETETTFVDNSKEDEDKDKDDKKEDVENCSDDTNKAKKDEDEDDKKTVCKSEEDKEEEGEIKDDSTSKEEKEDEDKKQVGKATASDSVATLSEQERQELESYRRNAKINVIDSYTEDLSEDVLKQYYDNVDNYNLTDLEAKLALEFRKITKTNDFKLKQAGLFAKIETPQNYNECNPADVINKYKN